MDVRKKSITIIDVAAAAGVSKTTVSRYLNGKFEFMSSQSRERIAATIERLNYRPNNLARGLKSKRSKLLGVIVSDIKNPFSSILLKGIGDCCERYGYGVLITNTDDDPVKEREYIEAMIDQHVDGIILNTTGQNLPFLMQMVKEDMPIVLADRPIEVKLFDTVRTEDRKSMFEGLQHLYDQGCRSVGLFTEALENGTRICRSEAYQDAYREIFGKVPQIYFVDTAKEEETVAVLEQFMADNAGVKRAIFTANGTVTLQVVRTMLQAGLHFPEDIALCGFDNWEWTGLVEDGITVVEQPTYKVGRECVKRMMARIYRSPNALPKLIELPCNLIIRKSSQSITKR